MKQPSEKVIERVAAAENVNPGELDDPLYDVIDPDALDALFHPAETNGGVDEGTVQFTFHGYDVSVSADGDVSVTDQE